MKTTVLLFAAFICMAFSSLATTHTITVASFMFTPNSIPDVSLGDTILWTWLNGGHTTTSTTIPSGAVPWTHDMNAGSTSFTYVPAVVGTYNYQCNIHGAAMSGSFVVNSVTQVGAMTATATGVYPNPASDYLHLRFNTTAPVSVTLTDMAGKQLISEKFTGANTADINLRDIPSGNYVIYSVQGQDVNSQQLVVKH